MASKRKRFVLDDGDDDLLSSGRAQLDEFLLNIHERAKELISNAEQEAITIVTEAVQRMEAMKAEHIEAMKKELANWEEEKKRIASTHNFEPMVTLNVGGKTFNTATATLTRFPDTMLGAMFSGRYALQPDQHGAYCIDRDGRHFHEILNFLRGTTTSAQEQIDQRLSPEVLKELKVEADFYGVKDLMFPIVKGVVSITGATGPYTSYINGMYERTTDLLGDMPVYKRGWPGYGSTGLEYCAASKRWVVKQTNTSSSSGGFGSGSTGLLTSTSQDYAYCVVPDKCLLKECPVGTWQVWNNNNYENGPSMTVEVAEGK